MDRSSQPRGLDVREGADQCGEQLLVAGDRAEEWDGSRADVRVVPRGVHVQVRGVVAPRIRVELAEHRLHHDRGVHAGRDPNEARAARRDRAQVAAGRQERSNVGREVRKRHGGVREREQVAFVRDPETPPHVAVHEHLRPPDDVVRSDGAHRDGHVAERERTAGAEPSELRRGLAEHRFALFERRHDRIALVAGEEGGVLRGLDREGVERDHVGRCGLVDDVAARVVGSRHPAGVARDHDGPGEPVRPSDPVAERGWESARHPGEPCRERLARRRLRAGRRGGGGRPGRRGELIGLALRPQDHDEREDGDAHQRRERPPATRLRAGDPGHRTTRLRRLRRVSVNHRPAWSGTRRRMMLVRF